MPTNRYFDQILNVIERGNLEGGLTLLAGQLASANLNRQSMNDARKNLRAHQLHRLLLEDPYTARAFHKPRGYAGDAQLIDLIYDRQVPDSTSDQGRSVFAVTSEFPTSAAVRSRRDHAETILLAAHQAGKKICTLACGHFREGDPLIGEDLRSITAVDQDPLSLDFVRARHSNNLNLVEANVIHYLRAAAKEGAQFDLIYTLGLTDYFEERAMALLHKLMKACLAPGGTILLANFLPGHLAIGWMDACMDWNLIYRDEANLEAHAAAIGMKTRTFRDPTAAIVWSEMTED